MKAIVSNRVDLLDVPVSVAREIKSNLTLRNPEYEQRQRAGASVEETPQTVRYWVENEPSGLLTVPRGALRLSIAAATRAGVSVSIEDKTRILAPVDIQFKGNLRLYQLAAAAALLRKYSGVVDAPTAAGKTVLALSMIAERRQPALVIVPTEKLLEQWILRAKKFLQLPSPVGVIGGGKWTIGKELTIGIINSVETNTDPLFLDCFGHLIIDECHRAPGDRYMRVISACAARYMLGLSATPYRRDGLTSVINWLLGPITKIDKAPLVASGSILPAEIEQRETDFDTELDASENYQEVIEELIANPGRNQVIAADVAQEDKRPGVTLILSDRKAHCGLLMAYLKKLGIDCARLQGGMSKKQKVFYQGALESEALRTIVATTQFVGEGWDYPKVGTLLLSTPIKFSGKLIQAIGRALRPAPGMDRARIIDYVDSQVGVLRQSGRSRSKIYQEEVIQWKS